MKRCLFLSLVLGCWIAIPVALLAQTALTPELLWKIGRISEERVSPDGNTILFGVTYYDLAANKGNRDLYSLRLKLPTDKGKDAIKSGQTLKITNTPESEYNALWRPDGLKIGYLSAKSGDMQLWEMNPDGSGALQASFVEGGISNFAYSPDGKHVSYTRNVKIDQNIAEVYPDLPLAKAFITDDLMYRHWTAWHDYTYSHLFVADYADGKVGEAKDIMAGERYDTPLPPLGGGEQIAWSTDGKTIAYSCKKVATGKEFAVSTNSAIYLYDLASGTTTSVTEGMMGYDNEPSFSPDGKWMAWLSMERDGFESDRNRIYLYNITDGTRKELLTDKDRSAGHLAWGSDSKSIYFTSDIKGTVQVFNIETGTGKLRQITEGQHNWLSVHVARGVLVGELQSMSYPTELYTIDPNTGSQSKLTLINQDVLKGVEWGDVKPRAVKTTDGKEMLAWVIYPPNFDPAKKYPTLLYCQGGPQSAVSQFFSYRWNFQLMAANGYIVVAPNRRGLPGFGQAWNDDISGDWGGQPIKDYLSATDDIKKEAYVDGSRIGAVGASYGGYSVYFLAGNHQKRFKTFIAHCGLFNLESWYGATEEMFFANWDMKGAYYAKTRPKSYDAFSPHKFVQNWDTPILVIHSEKDFRVPVTEGMQAFNSAQLMGLKSRFLYFPEEGHWVTSPQNSVLWQRVYFQWLKETL
jgi:dipeptidyl aminopeptidase/acylaminoacyl peptidase